MYITAVFPLTLILRSLVTVKHHWLNKMLHTNTTGSLWIMQQNGYKVFAVFMILSLRGRKKKKEKKKKTLEHIVPSWDSNPAPPKLASHISIKSSHLVNCIGHAHSVIIWHWVCTEIKVLWVSKCNTTEYDPCLEQWTCVVAQPKH